MRRLIPLFLACSLSLLSCTTVADETTRLVSAQNRLGTLYLDNGEYLFAIDAFDRTLAQDSDNGEALYGKVLAYLGSGEYRQAISLADSAFERYPMRLRFLKAKAAALSRLGEISEAMEVYGRLLELDPGDYLLHAQVMRFASDHGLDDIAEREARFLFSRNRYTEEAVAVLARIAGDEGPFALIGSYLQDLT